MAGESSCSEPHGFDNRQSKYREGFVRKDAQEQTAFAVENRILEPAAALRVVGEKSVRQCLLQRSYRNSIHFPEVRAPGQIIGGGAAHALTRLLASGKWLYNHFKWPPDRRLRASIGSDAIDREFVRADLATPLDQAP